MERWKNDGKNFSKNKRLKRKENIIVLICLCLIEEIEIVNNFLLFGWEGKKKLMKQIIILCWLLLYKEFFFDKFIIKEIHFITFQFSFYFFIFLYNNRLY